jgi:O-antigen/teichoic acid export membrane protein
MPETKEPPPTVDHKPHAAFFRQSGWLMVTNIVGGMATLCVHPLSKKMDDSEYTAFIALLAMVVCLPTIPFQSVAAQQTAQKLAINRPRQLAGMLRIAWFWTFLVWVAGASVLFAYRNHIAQIWQLPSVTSLLVTLPVLLASLLMPMFFGAVQGRQDFFWLGWAQLLSGVGRLIFAAIFVLAFHAGATGMMTGALIGVGLGAVIGIWRTRDLWTAPAEPFEWKPLMRQVVPLLLGFGAFQFLFGSDSLFTKAYFSGDAMKPYMAAGTLSRGLLWIVLPMATVMFPKLVHAHTKSEKTNLFNIVILGTAVMGICGWIGLYVAGPIAVRIVYSAKDVAGTMALIPWYAGAMVPLAMSTVMVNDLLARAKYQVVPFMVALAVADGLTMPYMLSHYHDRGLVVPLQTIGVFNLLLFGVCAVFTWGKFGQKKSEPAPIPAAATTRDDATA